MIGPMRECEVEFGPHEDHSQCASMLATMNSTFYPDEFNEDTWYANRGGMGLA